MEYKNNYIKYEKGLEKYTGNDELWEKDLESLREQIKDMCENNPINKIGNFI